MSAGRDQVRAQNLFANFNLTLELVRVPRRKKTTHSNLSSCRALMPIDSRHIRSKARRDYDKVVRDLAKAREELVRFERHDKPEFTRWMNREFGALITELRETNQRLQLQRELLFEVQSEAMHSNSSYARAYERVMWQREHPEAAEAEAKGKESNNNDDSDPWVDPFAAFSELFGDIEEDFARAFGIPPSDQAQRIPVQEEKMAAPRVKDLYRAVVRRLHPDTQGALTPEKADLWHQAQAAYENGDAEQLQLILTLCEIEEQGTTAKTSVSLLMRITQQFKSSLHALKKQLRQCQVDPAWNFEKLKERGPLFASMDRHLRAELFEIKRALEAINAQIDHWARQAQATARRRTTVRVRRRQPNIWF
jgi:hypothetical protein